MRDGRNVDLEVGALAGEGVQQEVGRVREPPTSHLDALAPEAGDGPSYHGLRPEALGLEVDDPRDSDAAEGRDGKS